jgi:hypothetical protein
MLYRVIKPQIIKRFCHHSSTKYGNVMDNLNDIKVKTDFTAAKIVKLEKELDNIGNVLAFNYFFTVFVIPASIFFTQ